MSAKKMNRPVTPAYQDVLRTARRDPHAPQPKCLERGEEYAFYEHPPTRAEAKELCEGCPLLAVCRESARRERPAWGVRGGIAWNMGTQIK